MLLPDAAEHSAPSVRRAQHAGKGVDVSMRDEGLANCPGRLKPTPPCMSLSPVHAGLVYITIAVESKYDVVFCTSRLPSSPGP